MEKEKENIHIIAFKLYYLRAGLVHEYSSIDFTVAQYGNILLSCLFYRCEGKLFQGEKKRAKLDAA
jgi:hypothetical protein